MHRGRIEQRTQILVDVGLAGEPAEAADAVERAEEVAVHRPHDGLGDRPPHRVHDRRAGVVVLAVPFGVESRRVACTQSSSTARACASRRARRGAPAQHLADDGPHRRARVLGRGAVHHAHVVGEGDLLRELVEQLDAMHGAERRVVAVHEARAPTGCSSSTAVRRGHPCSRGCCALAQEPSPLVVAGPQRRQATVESVARRGSSPDEKYAVPLSREAYAQLNVNPNSFAASKNLAGVLPSRRSCPSGRRG